MGLETEQPLVFERRCACYLQIEQQTALKVSCRSMQGKEHTVAEEYQQCLDARAENSAHHSHGASNDSQAQLNHSTRAWAMLHSRHEQLDRSLTGKKKKKKIAQPPTPRPTKGAVCKAPRMTALINTMSSDCQEDLYSALETEQPLVFERRCA